MSVSSFENSLLQYSHWKHANQNFLFLFGFFVYDINFEFYKFRLPVSFFGLYSKNIIFLISLINFGR
jgi:hypothetical protein